MTTRIRALLLLLCLLIMVLPSGIHATGSTHAATGTLVFDDEFSGTSLDTTTWTALHRPGDASNAEAQCYLPSNAVEANGALTITDRIDPSCSGFSYTSAMVQTASYHFTYGTLEVRAQLPRGGGQWPALWLLGANCQATNPTSPDNSGACQWPTPGSNEIDMFEGKGQVPSQGFFNLNTGTAANNDNQAFGCNNVPLPVDTSAAPHTYDLIWAPGSLTWQVDGIPYCATTSHVPSTAMFILLNVALGGFAGTIDTSAFPQSMVVDYVRVYQQAAGTPTLTPTATNTPGGPTATRTVTRTPTKTRTPTPTATPGSSTTLGSLVVSGGGFDAGGDANDLDGIRVVTGSAGAQLVSMSAYVGNIDASSKTYGLAVYADSGGKPSGLVAFVTGTLGAQGWNTLPLTATLAPSTPYWLVYNTATSNTADNLLYVVSGPSSAGGWATGVVPCCAFPSLAGAWTLFGNQYAIYASLASVAPTATPTSSATPTNVPTNTSTPTDSPTDTPTATGTDTATVTDTPTPPGLLTAYGCLLRGVAYTFNSTLTDPGGAVIWSSPPTPYAVDNSQGWYAPCTPGG